MTEMAEKNFVLIGVNSDKTPEKALAAVEKNSLNWRSFQNTQSGGKISTTWGVKGWPTIVVIDADLKIVYRGHDGHQATKIAKKMIEEESVDS